MGYVCGHEDCQRLAEGIRKCKSCGKVIITDRGIDGITEDWEIID